MRPHADLPFRALLPFLLLTFGLAWGLFALYMLAPDAVEALTGPLAATNPLFILAVYAPAISAVILVLWHSGRAGLARFLSRLGLWRCSPAWWVFLVLGIPAVSFAGAALKGDLTHYTIPFATAGQALAAVGFMVMLGPMEEFGWRGLALPLLQRRLVPLAAGLVLGVIWGAWHLPAFLLSGTPQSAWDFTPFLVGSVSVSVILTPLFNRAGGSILMAALFHFQLNNPFWPDAQPYDMYLFALVAGFVVWLNRDTMLTRSGATRVVPAA